MENSKPGRSIHPLVAAAAASVVVVSLVGVAAMTGMLPNSKADKVDAEVAALAQPAPAANASAPAANDKPVATRPEAPARTHAPAPVRHAKAPTAPQAVEPQGAQVAAADAACNDCGKVTGVRAVEHEGKGSGMGIAAGAVAGGLLGNQIGKGTGNTIATIAGAVGGGYAGNEIEKRVKKATTWEVDVRMEDGKTRSFSFAKQPAWKAGDKVKVVNGELAAQ